MLQEVAPGGLIRLQELVDEGVYGAVIASPVPKLAPPKRSVLLVGRQFRIQQQVRTVHGVKAPHKLVWVILNHESGVKITVASFHVVPASQYGREAKRDTFRAIVRWMASQTSRTIVGIDANSPITDAYCDEHGPECLCETRYFPGRLLGLAHGRRFEDPKRDSSRPRWTFDQEEYLLHDRLSAPPLLRHSFHDLLRSFLRRDHAAATVARSHFLKIAKKQPNEGCLAVSHINRGNKRRFDFIYGTPDIVPRRVEYRWKAAHMAGADHAVVIAAIEITDRR